MARFVLRSGRYIRFVAHGTPFERRVQLLSRQPTHLADTECKRAGWVPDDPYSKLELAADLALADETLRQMRRRFEPEGISGSARVVERDIYRDCAAAQLASSKSGRQKCV